MGNTQRHRYFVYIRAILFSIIAAMTSYQHTSFLGSFGLTDTYISIVYVAASLVSVCLVWYLALKKKTICYL